MFWLIVSFGVFLAAVCVVGVGAVRHRPRTRRVAAVHWLGVLLFFGGVLNFVAFWHVSVSIGGNAVSGKVEDGRYFVSSRGRLTEVSEATWRYSYAHKASIWITHPLGALGCLLLYWADRERKKLQGAPVPPDSPPSAQTADVGGGGLETTEET
jgi:hypothetical protein